MKKKLSKVLLMLKEIREFHINPSKITKKTIHITEYKILI